MRESTRYSRDTYPEPYTTKYTLVYEDKTSFSRYPVKTRFRVSLTHDRLPRAPSNALHKEVVTPLYDAPCKEVATLVCVASCEDVATLSCDAPCKEIATPLYDAPCKEVVTLTCDASCHEVATPLSDAPFKEVATPLHLSPPRTTGCLEPATRGPSSRPAPRPEASRLV